MHARRHVELASWLTINAEAIVQCEFGDAADFWTAAKCRMDRWHQTLKMFQNDLNKDDPNHSPWHAIAAVVEEVIISEMLTRVLAALLSEHDARNGTERFFAISQSVLLGHLEARNRALKLLVDADDSHLAITGQLNRLRRVVERWTDMLLSQLPRPVNASHFAFDHDRVMDFADDRLPPEKDHPVNRTSVLEISMLKDIYSLTGKYSANPDLNRYIATGIIATIVTDRFATFPIPTFAASLPLDNFCKQAERLVAQWSIEA